MPERLRRRAIRGAAGTAVRALAGLVWAFGVDQVHVLLAEPDRLYAAVHRGQPDRPVRGADPDSTVRLLDGCGHAITEDCADEVSEHMAGFLR